MKRSLVLLLAIIAACDGGSRSVAVRVSVPGLDSLETPASEIGVVALPYDRDSVLRALEAAAATPRPSTARLDSAFADFRGPFVAYSRVAYALTAARESVRTLESVLDTLPRTSERHAAVSAELRRGADSVAALERRAAAARSELELARNRFRSDSDSLRAAIRLWQDSTYRGWDSIVGRLAGARRAEPIGDTTNARGWAHFTLPAGRWWVHARAWDVSDPNAEYYWNIPVDSDTILLSGRTARRLPKY